MNKKHKQAETKILQFGIYILNIRLNTEAQTLTWKWMVERIRTNIGHIRLKMSGTYFPDRVEHTEMKG